MSSFKGSEYLKRELDTQTAKLNVILSDVYSYCDPQCLIRSIRLNILSSPSEGVSVAAMDAKLINTSQTLGPANEDTTRSLQKFLVAHDSIFTIVDSHITLKEGEGGAREKGAKRGSEQEEFYQKHNLTADEIKIMELFEWRYEKSRNEGPYQFGSSVFEKGVRRLTALSKGNSKTSPPLYGWFILGHCDKADAVRGVLRKNRVLGPKTTSASVAVTGGSAKSITATSSVDDARDSAGLSTAVYTNHSRLVLKLLPHYREEYGRGRCSLIDESKIDPNRILCRYDLSGSCLDDECTAQHIDDYSITPMEALHELASFGGNCNLMPSSTDAVQSMQMITKTIEKPSSKGSREKAEEQLEVIAESIVKAINAKAVHDSIPVLSLEQKCVCGFQKQSSRRLRATALTRPFLSPQQGELAQKYRNGAQTAVLGSFMSTKKLAARSKVGARLSRAGIGASGSHFIKEDPHHKRSDIANNVDFIAMDLDNDSGDDSKMDIDCEEKVGAMVVDDKGVAPPSRYYDDEPLERGSVNRDIADRPFTYSSAEDYLMHLEYQAGDVDMWIEYILFTMRSDRTFGGKGEVSLTDMIEFLDNVERDKAWGDVDLCVTETSTVISHALATDRNVDLFWALLIKFSLPNLEIPERESLLEKALQYIPANFVVWSLLFESNYFNYGALGSIDSLHMKCIATLVSEIRAARRNKVDPGNIKVLSRNVRIMILQRVTMLTESGQLEKAFLYLCHVMKVKNIAAAWISGRGLGHLIDKYLDQGPAPEVYISSSDLADEDTCILWLATAYMSCTSSSLPFGYIDGDLAVVTQLVGTMRSDPEDIEGLMNTKSIFNHVLQNWLHALPTVELPVKRSSVNKNPVCCNTGIIKAITLCYFAYLKSMGQVEEMVEVAHKLKATMPSIIAAKNTDKIADFSGYEDLMSLIMAAVDAPSLELTKEDVTSSYLGPLPILPARFLFNILLNSSPSLSHFYGAGPFLRAFFSTEDAIHGHPDALPLNKDKLIRSCCGSGSQFMHKSLLILCGKASLMQSATNVDNSGYVAATDQDVYWSYLMEMTAPGAALPIEFDDRMKLWLLNIDTVPQSKRAGEISAFLGECAKWWIPGKVGQGEGASSASLKAVPLEETVTNVIGFNASNVNSTAAVCFLTDVMMAIFDIYINNAPAAGRKRIMNWFIAECLLLLDSEFMFHIYLGVAKRCVWEQEAEAMITRHFLLSALAISTTKSSDAWRLLFYLDLHENKTISAQLVLEGAVSSFPHLCVLWAEVIEFEIQNSKDKKRWLKVAQGIAARGLDKDAIISVFS